MNLPTKCSILFFLDKYCLILIQMSQEYIPNASIVIKRAFILFLQIIVPWRATQSLHTVRPVVNIDMHINIGRRNSNDLLELLPPNRSVVSFWLYLLVISHKPGSLTWSHWINLQSAINSLSHGRKGCDLKVVNFKLASRIDNLTRVHRVKIRSGNGYVSSDNDPLPEPKLNPFNVATCHH